MASFSSFNFWLIGSLHKIITDTQILADDTDDAACIYLQYLFPVCVSAVLIFFANYIENLRFGQLAQPATTLPVPSRPNASESRDPETWIPDIKPYPIPARQKNGDPKMSDALRNSGMTPKKTLATPCPHHIHRNINLLLI